MIAYLKESLSREEQVVWQIPQTEAGGAFISPGSLMKFDGSGSYDSDPAFIGKTFYRLRIVRIGTESQDGFGISATPLLKLKGQWCGTNIRFLGPTL